MSKWPKERWDEDMQCIVLDRKPPHNLNNSSGDNNGHLLWEHIALIGRFVARGLLWMIQIMFIAGPLVIGYYFLKNNSYEDVFHRISETSHNHPLVTFVVMVYICLMFIFLSSGLKGNQICGDLKTRV
jgi:hypothetical protein